MPGSAGYSRPTRLGPARAGAVVVRPVPSPLGSGYGSVMPDAASDESGVLEAVRELDEALERRDLDAALAACTTDVVFIGSGEGEQAVGKAAVAAMAAELASR